jgi:Zn-dependent M28 family amino/carboxypeptidase
MGLQGSTYFSEHVPAQFQRVDAMFNFDMNGEGDGTAAIYSVKAPELKKVLEEADKTVKTLRQTGEIRDIGVRSSDFAPFFLKGADCVAFFSNGPHLAYHKTGDTIYRINPDIMADIARLAFLSAHAWADR